jgi:hypothetical protein
MDKYYSPYRYVIVTPKQLIDSSKYADTSVYRYVLGNSVTSYARVDGGYTKNLQTGIRTPNLPLEVAHTVVAFRFHDRSKDIYYRYSKSNSFIGDFLMRLRCSQTKGFTLRNTKHPEAETLLRKKKQ